MAPRQREHEAGATRADAVLAAAFAAASPEHFDWQTACPYVSDRERELVRRAFLPLGRRVLDVGCGEGATLVHLGAGEGAVGLDLFEAKVDFARRALPDCHFVVGSATDLPFDDGAFDHVIVRDLVHHVARPELLAFECRRVLRAGGRVDVLEPCRYNPLVLGHALSQRAERGELRSTARRLERVFGAAHFAEAVVTPLQALPLHRLVFHPRFGSPRLARSALATRLVAGLEGLAERALPRGMRAYLHLRAFAR